MNNKGLRWALLISAVLIIAAAAYACSPPSGTSARVDCQVKDEFLTNHACLDENCTYSTTFSDGKGRMDGHQIEYNQGGISYWQGYLSGAIEEGDKGAVTTFLRTACKEDTSSIRKHIEDGGSIDHASPYSTALIKELQAGKDNIVYEQCRYTDFRVVNGWIFQSSAVRSYCDQWFGPDCGGIAPNAAKYAAQLGGNPGNINENTLWPFVSAVAPWLIGGAIIILFLLRFGKVSLDAVRKALFFDKVKRNILILYLISYPLVATIVQMFPSSHIDFAIIIVATYIFLTILLAAHRKLASVLLAKRKTHATFFQEFLYPMLYGITGTIILSIWIYFMSGRIQDAGLSAILLIIGPYLGISRAVGPILAIPITLVMVGAAYFIIGRIALAIRTGIYQFKLDFIGNPGKTK